MKTRISSGLKIGIFIFCLSVVLFACGSNKSKIAGKWQVTRASVHAPEWQVAWDENAEKMAVMDNGGTGYDYSALKAKQDSLIKIKEDEDNVYKNTTYEFKEDGSAIVNREGKDITCTWAIEEGNENNYVQMKKDGKMFEQWYLAKDELNCARFENDHEIMTELCNGQLDRTSSYYVTLTLKATDK